MSELIVLAWLGGFILGAIAGHRFLPPRIDKEREQMLLALLDREAARKLRGES
jgi:hypothetical protein